MPPPCSRRTTVVSPVTRSVTAPVHHPSPSPPIVSRYGAVRQPRRSRGCSGCRSRSAAVDDLAVQLAGAVAVAAPVHRGAAGMAVVPLEAEVGAADAAGRGRRTTPGAPRSRGGGPIGGSTISSTALTAVLGRGGGSQCRCIDDARFDDVGNPVVRSRFRQLTRITTPLYVVRRCRRSQPSPTTPGCRSSRPSPPMIAASRSSSTCSPISQPAISRHLRLLREAGVVTVQPNGKQRIYRLNPSVARRGERLGRAVPAHVGGALRRVG